MQIEFPYMPAEILLDRDSVFFGAYVDGKPVKCVISFEVLLGARSDDPLQALNEFHERKPEIYQLAKQRIEQGEVRNSELVIQSESVHS
jgi:hypothetical protein